MSILFPFTTLSFAYPALFLAPLFLVLVLTLRRSASSAVAVASGDAVSPLAHSWRVRLRQPTIVLGTGLGVLLVTVAAARPQHITILPVEREARNLMLVVDVSRSMEIADFASPLGEMSRMDAIKFVLGEFIEKRRGDRIGVSIFGQQAFLQAPLTTDTEFLKQLIDGLQPRIAGDGTALGEGLGVGLRRIREVAEGARAIILVTDGVGNAGSVNPLQAAQVARDLGITVHTIGIGSHTPIGHGIVGGLLGLPAGRSEFDEDTLKEIASMTGGVYRNASSLAGLQDIYRELDRLERTTDEEPERKIIQELFPLYLSWGFLLLVITSALSRTIFLRSP